jgi:hypothetical protein
MSQALTFDAFRHDLEAGGAVMERRVNAQFPPQLGKSPFLFLDTLRAFQSGNLSI